VGDELDIEVVDRKLILRPLNEVEREQKLKSTTEAIFERRKSAYQRLAEGPS
jgi:virulence-associated protein VagC